jgi:ferrous iron transport protein A
MHRFMRRFGWRAQRGPGPARTQMTLAQMSNGQSGVVVDILGGRRMADRLVALGIRPGLRLTKVGAMLMRGPVTVQIGNAQLAVGFGMANRVIVKPG